MSTPRRTPEFSPQAIEQIARTACALQGCPEDRYHLIAPAERFAAERGVYNVLAALESLGWKVLPPESLSRIWLPSSSS